MKRIIILIMFAIAALNCGAKEIAKNFQTGTSLDCTDEVYSIKSSTGVVVLGDLKSARNIMYNIDKSFTQNRISEVLKTGDQKFEIKSDDEGYYICKVGLGLVKIRPQDAAKFLICLEARMVKTKGTKIWETIKQ